jgi:ribosomal protein S18 acetylase RimI-like enzyme
MLWLRLEWLRMLINKDQLKFRKAKLKDLEGIISLLADDFLGGKREKFQIPLPKDYILAFEAINKSHDNLLIVVDHPQKKIIGTMQLIFIPGLSYQGRSKVKIEAVRVDKNFRSQGIGKIMMDWAVTEAKKRGCGAIQLVTSIERKDTHKFYHRFGFESESLIAMELNLE